MNSQNTPVHVRLWHRDFWLMLVANMLLSISVYILIPVLPEWLLDGEKFGAVDVGWSMGVFALGLYAFGAFCSFLVQRFRRNKVCIFSIIAMACCTAALYYMHGLRGAYVTFKMIMLQRFFFGATYGLALMVLSSTLIIDTSESYRRTEANHSAGWFSRFAISVGPMLGIVLYRYFGLDAVLLASLCCTLVSGVFILTVNVPFRTPSDKIPVVSLDRFILPHSLPVFINMVAVISAIGLLLSLGLSERFYGLMMLGFLLALLAQRFVFRDAEMKSEVVSGIILLIATVLMIMFRPVPVVWYISPITFGLGIGIIGARFLLFFIKLSYHCRRGTSQSMYLLGWETGLALGIGLGYMFFLNEDQPLCITAIVLLVLSLIMYVYFTHNWFMENKNR